MLSDNHFRIMKARRRRIRDKENQPLLTPVSKKFASADLESSREMQEEQFDMEMDTSTSDLFVTKPTKSESDHFSPCRTRSGCVYESGQKKRRLAGAKRSRKGLRMRVCSGQSGTGSLADCSENSDYEAQAFEDNHRLMSQLGLQSDPPAAPPPLNYHKQPMSRFSELREKPNRHDIPSSPMSSYLHDEQSSPVKHFAKVHYKIYVH